MEIVIRTFNQVRNTMSMALIVFTTTFQMNLMPTLPLLKDNANDKPTTRKLHRSSMKSERNDSGEYLIRNIGNARSLRKRKCFQIADLGYMEEKIRNYCSLNTDDICKVLSSMLGSDNTFYSDGNLFVSIYYCWNSDAADQCKKLWGLSLWAIIISKLLKMNKIIFRSTKSKITLGHLLKLEFLNMVRLQAETILCPFSNSRLNQRLIWWQRTLNGTFWF